MRASHVLRFFNTVRHLRWEQVFWRIRQRLYRPGTETRPGPNLRAVSAGWAEPIRRPQSFFGPWRFRFLNREGELDSKGGWQGIYDRLWTYNLHYFDDLGGEGAEERTEWHLRLIERWIRENPAGEGPGWEPYPVSRRMVNWIKWSLGGNRLPDEAVQSLAIQARWLRRRIERHLLGNHIFANAKALVFAGLFFEGGEAQSWLREGTSLMTRELSEQVLNDGGHFELSPMYHLIVLEDLLDLINVARAYGRREQPSEWVEAAERMLAWADIMTHPDGGIPFFNDAAFGVAGSVEEVGCYAERLGLRKKVQSGEVFYQPDSGYSRIQHGPFVVFFDTAGVGPDYQPGHAHADTLSLEASVGGRRILVNSGTSVYGTGPERQRQRGTAAHNTLMIDGEDSSEVWAGFRVARRAYVHDIEVEQAAPRAAAWHDGYERLKGRPRHWREVSFEEGMLKVSDRVTGGKTHEIEGRWHLHPDVEVLGVERVESTFFAALRVREGEERLTLTVEGPVEVEVEDASYHPEFGLSLETKCIVFGYKGELPLFVVSRLSV